MTSDAPEQQLAKLLDDIGGVGNLLAAIAMAREVLLEAADALEGFSDEWPEDKVTAAKCRSASTMLTPQPEEK